MSATSSVLSLSLPVGGKLKIVKKKRNKNYRAEDYLSICKRYWYPIFTQRSQRDKVDLYDPGTLRFRFSKKLNFVNA